MPSKKIDYQITPNYYDLLVEPHPKLINFVINKCCRSDRSHQCFTIFLPPSIVHTKKKIEKKKIEKNITFFASFQICSKRKPKLRTTHSYCSDQKSIHTSTTMRLCLNGNGKTVRTIIAPTIERTNARHDWCWDPAPMIKIENSNNLNHTIIRHDTIPSVISHFH